LVHEVCRTGELEAAGDRIIDAVLMNAPGATRITKRRALASARALVDDGELKELIEEHALTRQQEEAAEGLASFRDKRKPGWYPT
jgi:methylglutaconyl-CoA hydratase